MERAAEELEEFDLSPIPKQTEFMSAITTTTHGEQIATTNHPIFGTPIGRSGPTAHVLSHSTTTIGTSGTAGGRRAAGSVSGPGAATTGRESEPAQGPTVGLEAQPAGQGAAGQAGVVPMAHESMNGLPPEIFDGQRKTASKFMTRLRLWKFCNPQDESMLNPFERVALALSYMKGGKVDDWVSERWDKISTKVQGDQGANPPIPPTHLDTDEEPWTNFGSDFERAFADTTPAEQIYAELRKLKMKGDEGDEYITKFEHLMMKAGWERTARGSLEVFK